MLSIINFNQTKNSHSFTLTDELNPDFCDESNIELYSDEYYELLSDVQQDDLSHLAWVTKNLEQANGLIAIAELGLWHGKRIAYKNLNHSNNLRDVIMETSSSTGEHDLGKIILNENGDIAYSLSHHDGTDYIVIRERKSNVSDTNWEKMLDAIYNQDIEKAEILIRKNTKKTGKYIKHFLK